MTGGGGGTARVIIDIPAGHVLDNRYRIRRKLGQGGYGEVYEVDDDFAGAMTALKVIPYHDETSKRNLLLEFKSRERIRDFDHVIKGLDPRPVTYLSQNLIVYPMELAEKSLREWFNEHRDDLEERLEEGMAMFRQASRGVAAIHAAGLIHLDIKPENILLIKRKESKKGKEEWTAKVSDLGLARGLGMEGLARYEDGVGTPAYMAPEQILAARAKDVGPEADIYALGMILYELLDGDLPFSGTPRKILEKKRDPNIEIAELKTSHPAGEVAMACLDRDKRKRPATVELLLDGLDKGLARAKVERENREKAKKLVEEAKRLIDKEELEKAHQKLEEAKKLDITHPEITGLLKQVNGKLEEIQKKKEAAEKEQKRIESERREQERQEEECQRIEEERRVEEERRHQEEESRQKEDEERLHLETKLALQKTQRMLQQKIINNLNDIWRELINDPITMFKMPYKFSQWEESMRKEMNAFNEELNGANEIQRRVIIEGMRRLIELYKKSQKEWDK